MKKILFTLIIVMLLLITGCSKKEASLLAVVVNYDFKYGATYDGIAIFNDGTVYTKYLSSSKSEYNTSMGGYSINTKDGIIKYYKEKAVKKEYKVANSDLNKIKKYIKNMNDNNVDTNCKGDAKIYSTLFVYKNNEEIKLTTSDDCNGSVKDLLEIINSYKKR